ncbi:MAG: hypothetical protein R6V52_07385 [Bacteroidales bacterium]
MKTRRLIFYLSLLAFGILVFGLAYVGIKSVNQNVSEIVGDDGGTGNITRGGIRIIHRHGQIGISIKDLLITREENHEDTLFFAEYLLVSSSPNFFKSEQSRYKVIALSPQMHVYPQQEEITDSIEISEELPEFQNAPSMYISDLSIHIHRQGRTVTARHLHIRGKPTNNNYELELKYEQDSNLSLHAGTKLSRSGKIRHLDSSFLNLNDTRLANFSVILTEREGRGTDISWHAWLDSTFLDNFSVQNVQYSGQMAFHSVGNYTSGEKSSTTDLSLSGNVKSPHGKIDSIMIRYEGSSHFSPEDSASVSDFLCLFRSGTSHARLHSDYRQGKAGKKYNLTHTAKVKPEDLNLFSRLQLPEAWESSYHAGFSENGSGNISGRSRVAAQISNKGKAISIRQQADDKGSRWMVSADDFQGSADVTGLFASLVKNETPTADIEIRQQKLQISERTHKGAGITFTESEKRPSVARPDLNGYLQWRVDSLFYDSMLISTKNDLHLHLRDKQIKLTCGFSLEHNISGPLQFSLTKSGNKKYSGYLSSPGLQVKNQQELPLLRNNLKLNKGSTRIQKFSLPYHTHGDSLFLRTSSIRTEGYMLHLKGFGTTEHQSMNLGITAPAGKFTGMAGRLLQSKSVCTDSATDLQTVLLRINRKNGKVNIKTKVQDCL